MTQHRIVIVGPGAVGCALATELARRGGDVALLDHRPDRAAAIERDGLRVEDDGATWEARVPCRSSASELGAADLLIVLVKAYSTESAVRHAQGCIGPDTAVLTLQNGLGNHETIARLIGPRQVLAGTIVMGATSLGVGHVRLSGKGAIVIGSASGNTELAERAAEALGRFWTPVDHEPQIEAAVWRKVIVNAAVNPLTALTGLLNGQLLEMPDLRATLGAIVLEATVVARAAGIAPFAGDAVEAVEQVCRVTGRNRSSMLQDVLAGRPTEIRQICGEIVARGEALGAPTPLCRAMVALVEAGRGPANDGRG